MMERNVPTVIVPVLLVAGTTNAAEIYNKDGNKVDLYGKAVGLHYSSKGDSENGYGGNDDMTYARLGFKGGARINSDPTGYGQWEYNFQGDNSEGADAQTGNKTHLAFTGLRYVDIGSFDYGRNYDVVYGALGYTGILPELSGDAVCNNNFLVNRIDGIATYRNSSFFGLVDGLSFAIQYLGRNECDAARRSNGDGVGGSISYEYEGFGIVGAYGTVDRINLQKEFSLGKGEKAEQWAIGLKYDANNIYLAANYSETRNATPITNKSTNTSDFANKTQGVLLVAQYQFDFGLRPFIAYTKSKARDIEGVGDIDLVNYFEVDATYYFNKNMFTYVDYIINQIDSDNKLDVDSDDTVTVGIVYQF